MEIKDLEPFVKSLNMEPKHLIMERGRQVKWLVCKKANEKNEGRIVIYNAEGEAYCSRYMDYIDEDFFNSSRIGRSGDGTYLKNEYFCRMDKYDFKACQSN